MLQALTRATLLGAPSIEVLRRAELPIVFRYENETQNI